MVRLGLVPSQASGAEQPRRDRSARGPDREIPEQHRDKCEMLPHCVIARTQCWRTHSLPFILAGTPGRKG